jgi:hypothetical protein
MVKLVDVVVGERVKDVLAYFARGHDAQRAKDAQLIGDGGLAHAQDQTEIADTKFNMRQQPDDTDARRVGERLEQFGDARGSNAVEQMGFGGVRQRCIGMVVGADGQSFVHATLTEHIKTRLYILPVLPPPVKFGDGKRMSLPLCFLEHPPDETRQIEAHNPAQPV